MMGSEYAAVYTDKEMVELVLHAWESVRWRWQQSITENTWSCQNFPLRNWMKQEAC